jgi:hypothetical protein
MYFKNGKLVVIWGTPSGTDIGWSVWTLDEFGNVTTGAGPFTFSSTSVLLGGVEVSQINSQQVTILNWLVIPGTGKAGLNTWTVDTGGNVISANSFGPF